MDIVKNKTLSIKSPAFAHKAYIPSKYTCNGLNISPELNIGDLPVNVKTLALIVDDPDAPKGTFDHWIMWNIPPENTIEENSSPGIQGKNGKQENKYYGPCPPSGTHHYHFKVFALDTRLSLNDSATKSELLEAMEGHILSSGELIGLYQK